MIFRHKYRNPGTVPAARRTDASSSCADAAHASRLPHFLHWPARLGWLLAVCLVTGCTHAPSWPTVQECELAEQEFPNRCGSLPDWGIARDFKALESDAAATSLRHPSAAGLPRLRPQEPRPPYRIGPLDELSITVWGSKEIWSEITDQSQQPTRVTVVQEDGTIVLPLLPNLKVEGLTLGEALAKITGAYRQALGSSFQVTGQISRFRSQPVLVGGAVTRPGTVYLSSDVRTLGEAVEIGGGGFPAAAELSKGVLIRGDQRYGIDYQGVQTGENHLHEILLQPGDRIYFPSRESGRFYVMGEVPSPGTYPIPPKGVTLMQGLTMARAPSVVTSNMDSIFLVRVAGEQTRIYRLTLTEIMANKDQPLEAGDRIFVSTSGLASWDRFWRQLLPFLTSGYIVYDRTWGPFGTFND